MSSYAEKGYTWFSKYFFIAILGKWPLYILKIKTVNILRWRGHHAVSLWKKRLCNDIAIAKFVVQVTLCISVVVSKTMNCRHILLTNLVFCSRSSDACVKQ